MTVKLIVGYRTRLVDGAAPPEFTCSDRRLKDEKKIQDNIDKQAEAWDEEAKNQPYTGTFDEVFIVDPSNEAHQSWKYKGREPGSGKSPICASVASWILANHETAFSDDLTNHKQPEVIFVGFGMRRFLKILGLECSLPRGDRSRVPVSMWFGNSDHRDVENAVKPSDFKFLDWATVIAARRPADDEEAGKYDEVTADWAGPGHSPAGDVLVALEFCGQLGLLADG
jgi:hypothetical protein